MLRAGILASTLTFILLSNAAAERRSCSFKFPGLRTELRRADAIVHFRPTHWQGDSILGINPITKTWFRITQSGLIVRAFDGLRTGDSLVVMSEYSRRNAEFYELEQMTQQFIFDIVPGLGSEAILLLRRTRTGWETTRVLYPDDNFIELYLRAGDLDREGATRALIRMYIDEFLGAEHWGHLRVIEDDLSRLGALPGHSGLWRDEANARADGLVRAAGTKDVATFVQIARYLPEPRRRDCVRQFVRAYDAAAEELRALGDVDMNPPEMTSQLYRYMNASGWISLLPAGMEALVPADRSRTRLRSASLEMEHLESILARARKYAGP